MRTDRFPNQSPTFYAFSDTEDMRKILRRISISKADIRGPLRYLRHFRPRQMGYRHLRLPRQRCAYGRVLFFRLFLPFFSLGRKLHGK